MQEEWKTIEGFSRYKVSNLGEIFDTKLDRLVAKQLAGIPQYYYVNLNRDDGKRKLERVHRFVAKAFVEGWSEEFDVVDHIDRDKFNNRFDNLRWTDRSGNGRNLENNLYVGDVFLKDFVLMYDNPDAAYSYISAYQRNMTIEEAIAEYDKYLEYGQQRVKVIYEGEEYYLLDLAEEKGVEYSTLRNKIVDGVLSWNSVYNVPTEQPYSFEISENRLMYWYPSKSYFCEKYGKSPETLRDAIGRGLSTEEILSIDGKDYLRQTVLGVTGTIRELCEHFKVSIGTVDTRMSRKGMTLEQALTAPRERVKRLAINDVYKSPKDWCIHFGINPKRFNAYRADHKLEFKEAFEHFGVDTKGMVFKDY